MGSWFRVFLATFCGAFLGAVVGLQFHHSLWFGIPIGMVCGGLIGFIGRHPRRFFAAIPIAWRGAKYGLGISWNVPARIAAWFREHRALAIAGFLGGASAGAWGYIMLFLLIGLGRTDHTDRLVMMWALPGMILPCGLLYMGLATSQVGENSWPFIRWLCRYNPLFVAVWDIPRGLLRLDANLPDLMVRLARQLAIYGALIGQFLLRLYRLTHTDEAVICLCDAALGAGVGVYFHNPLLWGVVGGVIGVLNAEIVAKRLLKTIPQEA